MNFHKVTDCSIKSVKY